MSECGYDGPADLSLRREGENKGQCRGDKWVSDHSLNSKAIGRLAPESATGNFHALAFPRIAPMLAVHRARVLGCAFVMLATAVKANQKQVCAVQLLECFVAALVVSERVAK